MGNQTPRERHSKELSVSSLKQIALAAGLGLLALTGSSTVAAQSTDGLHAIQIFPVVVDTGAFTQRFTFKNADAANDAVVIASYFPANGSAQVTLQTCPNFTIPAGGQKVFTSLRGICPSLAAGSVFGTLYTYTQTNATVGNTSNYLFAGYSRVSNPSGNGFSVEAFPAHTFTSADTIVTGLRRLTASGSNPAFQTNCFIGSVQELTAGANFNSTITYKLYNSANVQIGTGTFNLLPGNLVRLLDVFAAAGAPAGDYDDASIVISENGNGEPGLMTFCTVQDNTSFGADFRIGKQFRGWGTQYSGVGAQDDHVSRDTLVGYDIKMTGDVSAARQFTIPAQTVGNTHVVYFRHPDWVACEIIDPATHVRALPAYGLEIRLRDQLLNTLAGGNAVQGFSRIYLGDKTERNNGTNARYTIEVEDSETNSAAIRPYQLHCQSGSGHTLGDMVKFNIPGTF
jgi:hypothetical protein